MLTQILFAVLAFAAQAEAVNTRFCAAHHARLINLRQEAAATPFCIGYLSIGTTTITKNSIVTVTDNPIMVFATITVTVTADDLTLRTTSVVSRIISASAGATVLQGCYSHQVPTKRDTSSYRAEIGFLRPSNIPIDWPDPAVSLACSCLAIPSPTITKIVVQSGIVGHLSTATFRPLTTIGTWIAQRVVQSTVFQTVTSTTTLTRGLAAQPTKLSPEGLRFGVFDHRIHTGGEDIAAADDLRSHKILDSGTIQNLNFDIDIQSQTMFLDGRNMTARWRGINAAGYFLARTAGTYTFSTPLQEFWDEVFFWHGDLAYNKWGDKNADYFAWRDRWKSGAVSITLSAGQVMPVRYMWVNSNADLGFCDCDIDYGSSRLWITTPEGQVVKDSTGWFIRDCSDDTFSGIAHI
ncbi:hypothetical protein PFICI_03919 [Pestalotiopsis fici W106-1]|uniref:PA14 domain-containing protein n=1 Tax=Pestalotiopsis fici (strain W106-1 / CGMCC3.15140) TaxID=1229662 RepID=W3XIQ9_PESFW|nr:uncharacterized protein PFICI_03919 [Pestalotiopsis fici W106-1]ETS85894.1 hypothetical protein PFICI_03919 [Pestalotiopsis fici W106-1]